MTDYTEQANQLKEITNAQQKAGVNIALSSYNNSISATKNAWGDRQSTVASNQSKSISEIQTELQSDRNIYKFLNEQVTESETNLQYLSQMDRRASLTVAPKMGLESPTLFATKILYSLGTALIKNVDGSSRSFYNFLQMMLSKAGGIIFPYTPSIDTNYHVNYESTEIPQSNAQYNVYKNSPPPNFSVTAKFTANTKANTAYMLSVIWFLQALTKCDVGNGITYYPQGTSSGGGLPPPVLYFNAYHQLMENIPVVIQSFNIKYPDDIDYVNIVIDMENKDSLYFDTLYNEGKAYLNKEKEQMKKDSSSNKSNSFKSTLLNDTFKMSFWLPLEMTITMNLLIQSNLAKENNIFNLDAYKAGVLRNTRISNMITSAGTIENTKMFSTDAKSQTTAWSSGKKKYLPTGWSW